MLTLYLVRHAIAAERGEAWPDDALRPLTHAGIARMRAGVAGLRAIGVTFDVVLSSPLVRARQTAEVLVHDVDPDLPIVLLPALAPGQPPESVAKRLNAKREWTSVALVGHEPGLGKLAAWLIGASVPLAFKKGGVCRIDFNGRVRAGVGVLQWLALPKMLRVLAQ